MPGKKLGEGTFEVFEPERNRGDEGDFWGAMIGAGILLAICAGLCSGPGGSRQEPSDEPTTGETVTIHQPASQPTVP